MFNMFTFRKKWSIMDECSHSFSCKSIVVKCQLSATSQKCVFNVFIVCEMIMWIKDMTCWLATAELSKCLEVRKHYSPLWPVSAAWCLHSTEMVQLKMKSFFKVLFLVDIVAGYTSDGELAMFFGYLPIMFSAMFPIIFSLFG